jgi:hypothetical protein
MSRATCAQSTREAVRTCCRDAPRAGLVPAAHQTPAIAHPTTTIPDAPITTGLRRHNANNSRGFNTTASTLAATAATVGSTAVPALIKMGTTASIPIRVLHWVTGKKAARQYPAVLSRPHHKHLNLKTA